MNKLRNFATRLICWALDIPPFKCPSCSYTGDEPLIYGANGEYVKACPKCYKESPVDYPLKRAQ